MSEIIKKEMVERYIFDISAHGVLLVELIALLSTHLVTAGSDAIVYGDDLEIDYKELETEEEASIRITASDNKKAYRHSLYMDLKAEFEPTEKS
jgi:hypothetical protein